MNASLRWVTLTSALLLSVIAGVSSAAVFRVTNDHDSGPGSLRQAILDNNNTPGPNVIEIALSGASPRMIKVQGQFLPPLKGPVVVRVVDPAAPPPPVAAAPAAPPDPAAPAGAPGGRGAGARGGGGRGAVPATPAAAVDRVILDGSGLVKPRTPAACPGATAVYNARTNAWEHSSQSGTGPNAHGYYGAGLAVHDSKDVEISGLEIRNFCIGVATVRSSNVYIHDVKIVDSHGAAGVIFTGDDGANGRTELSFNNRLLNSVLLDNGEGVLFTNGTRDSLLQGTTISVTQPLPVPGNAVEFALSGDNNAVIGNTFSKYVDTAVTISGDHHTIRDNRFIDNEGSGMRGSGANLLIVGNTFAGNGGSGFSVSGAGTRVLDNVVTGNGGRGILVGSAGVRLSRNSIYDNAHLGIDVAAAGAGGGGSGGRGAPPAAGLMKLPDPPVIEATSAWTADGMKITGSVSGAPNQTYAVEIFVSRSADRHPGDEHGWGEGEKYLGTASATTAASGRGTFSLSMRLNDAFGTDQMGGFVAATSTDAAGSTSKFSRAVAVGSSKR